MTHKLIEEAIEQAREIVQSCKEQSGEKAAKALFPAESSTAKNPLNDLMEAPRYSVEPHGDGYAIYSGRSVFKHGHNLGQLTRCEPWLPQIIERALNELGKNDVGSTE